MNTITWNTYLLVIVVSLVVYLVLVFLYFSGIRRLLSNKKEASKSPQPISATTTVRVEKSKGVESAGNRGVSTYKEDVQNKRIQSQVHDMVNEVTAYIKQAGQEDIEKEELKQALYSIAEKYPDIKGSAFQDGIRNLAATTVEDYCTYRLSADELAVLWGGEQV